MEKRLYEILFIAMKYGVSDIHFELLSHKITIEMRIGDDIRRLKSEKDDKLLFHYLMYRANLDVSSLFESQSGQFEMIVNNNRLSLRFSILQSVNVISGVLRILNNHPKLQINDLCKDNKTYEYLLNITNYKNGLFLFSGATGSGKTTTLYTLLTNTKGKKIYTLEDPIEVYFDNFIQIQINEKQGMNYSEGIKQLMRQDPDIIMIGEIRDSIAAKMAVRTALTGHLVLSSIHASSCLMTINRMIELGVDKTQLFDVLNGITNQILLLDENNKKYGRYEIMRKEEIMTYAEKY